MFFKLLEANIAKLAPRPLVVFFFFSQLWSASQEFGALSPLQIFFAIYRFRKTLCRSRSLAPLNRDQSILRVVPAVVPATKPGRLRPDFRRTTLRPSSFHASVTLFFSACGGGSGKRAGSRARASEASSSALPVVHWAGSPRVSG